jgi:hypothetical protein
MRQSKKESSTEIFRSAGNRKTRESIKRAEVLLETHRLHLGLYKRISQRLGVDASYVSKVASGTRESESVMRMLLNQLNALQP